eukprot:7340418-Lingulodinium_polyedra.AAC.1
MGCAITVSVGTRWTMAPAVDSTPEAVAQTLRSRARSTIHTQEKALSAPMREPLKYPAAEG